VYKKALPSLKNPDIYMVEPYIYSQFAAGPDSPDYGRGGYHWMTGTAAWMFRVVLDYMLGIKADYDGLTINPCIPSHWDKFQVLRPYRGAIYKIYVENVSKVEKGNISITVDGKEISGNKVPVFTDGKTHEIFVKII
ncbi:MAG: glycosyl transferase, partial [Vallitaleaceae bacterium]|nr:glycosyl transferase [Vallitaleaceae bacterium]